MQVQALAGQNLAVSMQQVLAVVSQARLCSMESFIIAYLLICAVTAHTKELIEIFHS